MLHTQIFSLKFLFTFLSLSSFTLAQGCGSTNPLVGSKFALQQTTSLRLSGTITVLNDCIIQLSDFSFADPNRELHLTNGDFPITIFNGDVISQTLFSSQLFELLNGISLTTIKRLAVLSDNVILGFVNLRPPLVQSPAVSPIPQITTTTASPQVTQIATSTRTAVAAQATPVRLLAPKLLFVTVSPDSLVPIGVSYNLNGLKQPNLTLVRGTTYTFGVIAGTPHPFYLTSSPVGAKGANPNTTETVFAGSSKTFGTAEAPGYVTFTPETSTPNSLFYQCWFHGRMGGVVTVVDQKADGKYEVDVTGTNSTLPPVANVLGSGSNKVGAFWVLIIIGVVFSSF